MRAGKTIAVMTTVLAVGGLALGFGGAPWRAAADVGIPTARVTRGTLAPDLQLPGEFRAKRSIPLMAPAAANPLRILSLAETGTAVRAGDVVMEFDPIDQAHELEQSRSELLEAEQEIAKLKADADVEAAQAETDLLTAHFDVRRAELDTLGGERFLARNEVKRRELALEEARRHLAELEGAAPSQSAIQGAKLAVLGEKQTQARMTAERAQETIDNLVVRTPIDGVVIVSGNRGSLTFGFTGMTIPEYRVGDTTSRGRTVLEVVDIHELEILARVSENERPNVEVGQSATVVVDGWIGEQLTATVDAVAGMASSDSFFFGSGGPERLFDTVLTLDAPNARLRPGVSAQIIVNVRQLEDVLYVPPQAIFDREGQTAVYLAENETFVLRTVKVVGSGTGRVAIEGVAEGDTVALVDPASQEQSPVASTAVGAAQ